MNTRPRRLVGDFHGALHAGGGRPSAQGLPRPHHRHQAPLWELSPRDAGYHAIRPQRRSARPRDRGNQGGFLRAVFASFRRTADRDDPAQYLYHVLFWSAANLDCKLEAFRDDYNVVRVHPRLVCVIRAERAGAPCPAPAALLPLPWLTTVGSSTAGACLRPRSPRDDQLATHRLDRQRALSTRPSRNSFGVADGL